MKPIPQHKLPNYLTLVNCDHKCRNCLKLYQSCSHKYFFLKSPCAMQKIKKKVNTYSNPLSLSSWNDGGYKGLDEVETFLGFHFGVGQALLRTAFPLHDTRQSSSPSSKEFDKLNNQKLSWKSSMPPAGIGISLRQIGQQKRTAFLLGFFRT